MHATGQLDRVRSQMDVEFDPDDEGDHEAFVAARDDLVGRFEAASGTQFGWVASQVVDFKFGYLDGHLGRWSADDVHEILLGLYPAKVMLDAADWHEVSTGFAAFLRFLKREIPGHDPPLESLAELTERLSPQFFAAMGDESNWSFGKRMWATASAEGVDLADQASMERFIADFNERSLAERDAILGPLPGAAEALGRAVLGPLPPVVLPTEDELRRLAAETTLVRRIVGVVEYVGTGRPVTDKGNLKLDDGKALVGLLGTDDRVDERIGDRVWNTRSSADLRGVDLPYRLALETGMLRLERTKVRPGPNAGWAPDDPLAIHYGAVLALLRTIGPTQYHYSRHDSFSWYWFAEDLDRQLPMMLLDLYRRQDPIEIEELSARAWESLQETYDLSDVPESKLEFHRGLVTGALRTAFDRLVELGVLAIVDEERTVDEYGHTKRDGGAVELEPLGWWALQRFASRFTDAPVVGALREASAAALLAAAADLPEEIARAEIEAWIDAHGDRAATELCAALPDVDETSRGLGFRALLRIGPAAGEAVATLAGHSYFDSFVTVWRIDPLIGDAAEMDRAGDPEGFVRLLHTVIELWGPQAATSAWAEPAAGAPGIDAMLERVWRVKGAPTAEVLGAIGAHHHDKQTAKAARKALFKHRSAG
jgi:hypothetical protein